MEVAYLIKESNDLIREISSYGELSREKVQEYLKKKYQEFEAVYERSEKLLEKESQ